jgi:hypothetical protein
LRIFLAVFSTRLRPETNLNKDPVLLVPKNKPFKPFHVQGFDGEVVFISH